VPIQPQLVHYDLNTAEGKRTLAAFLKMPEWPEPQPITDAQKTGERFLIRYDWAPYPHWLDAYWDEKALGRGSWCGIGGEGIVYLCEPRVTHYLQMPPDVKPD
jgi:hypothetical protein